MLFNFELFAIEDVVPWTTPAQGNAQSVGWFGLTQGWYWIDTGAGELFRYSNELRQHWAQSYPGTIDHPYVDYFVVRLWEDILEMLPAILEPVPNDLADYIRPGGRWGSWAAWKAWSDRAMAWACDQQSESAGDLFYQSREWWANRRLDTGYLSVGPAVWFWRGRDRITIQWDNNGDLIDGLPAWANETGHISIPVSDFLAEVRAFDERLMLAMAERVDRLRHDWARPEVQLDWPKLRSEHRQRTAHLAAVLAQPPPQTNWEEARMALAEMERHLAEMPTEEKADESAV